MTATADLVAQFEALPSNATAATTVLRLVDDPDAGATDVAKAIAADPVFATRVLGLANSTYYGLSQTVSALPFAVSIIGFRAIRSLAVTAAAGLDRPGATPAGFWQVAAISATAADLVAPYVGADRGDAFTVGLLHTFGAALLHQHQTLPALCLPAPPDLVAHHARELDVYGISHTQAAARVLTAWNFPHTLVDAIATHHDPLLESGTPLQRALAAARTLTALPQAPPPHHELLLANLLRYTDGRLNPDAVTPLLDDLNERTQTLLSCLQPR